MNLARQLPSFQFFFVPSWQKHFPQSPQSTPQPTRDTPMPDPLITYDPRGVFLPEHGITLEELTALSVALDEARDEVLANAQLWADGVEPAEEQIPCDAGFHDLPDRLLADYRNF